MLKRLKVSLHLLLSFSLVLPVHSQAGSRQAGNLNRTKSEQSEQQASVVGRSPQDIMKGFIEQWNAAKNINDLSKLLKLSVKDAALLEKLKTAMKLKKQNLPKAEFNEEASMVSINNHKMQILSFAPLALFIDGKALVFDQEKDQERIDYLIKEYASLSKKSVLLNFLFPRVYAESFFGDYKTMFYVMGGVLAVTAIWGAWSNYSDTKEKNKKDINKALPKYKGLAEAVHTSNSKMLYLACNRRLGQLQRFSVYNNVHELYEFDFNTSVDNNDVKTLTVTRTDNSICKFMVEDAIWKRQQGMPASCVAPASNPYAQLDFAPIDEAKRCCDDPSDYCDKWVANDLVEQKEIGSKSEELKRGNQ